MSEPRRAGRKSPGAAAALELLHESKNVHDVVEDAQRLVMVQQGVVVGETPVVADVVEGVEDEMLDLRLRSVISEVMWPQLWAPKVLASRDKVLGGM